MGFLSSWAATAGLGAAAGFAVFEFFCGFFFHRAFSFAGQRFRGAKIQLAGRDVYGNYAHLHKAAQADSKAGTPAYNALRFLVVLPLVGAQVVHLNQAFNAVFAALSKDAKAGNAGNDAIQLVAYMAA